MFRNIRSFIPCEVTCTKLFEVHDDQIVEANLEKNLPCSNDYSLKDLLAAGVKVAPVDTSIVHDNIATSAVANDFVENYVESHKIDE